MDTSQDFKVEFTHFEPELGFELLQMSRQDPHGQDLDLGLKTRTKTHQESTETHLRSSPQDYQLWFGVFKISFETMQGRVVQVGTVHICKD